HHRHQSRERRCVLQITRNDEPADDGPRYRHPDHHGKTGQQGAQEALVGGNAALSITGDEATYRESIGERHGDPELIDEIQHGGWGPYRCRGRERLELQVVFGCWGLERFLLDLFVQVLSGVWIG